MHHAFAMSSGMRGRRRMSDALPAFAGSTGDNIIRSFETYEDYLDSQITATDLFYLSDLDLARQLVELGYRSNAAIMTRNQFIAQKDALEQARLQALQKIPKKIFSAGKDFSDLPFLKALADREKTVRQGSLATIIFIRDFNAKGHEDNVEILLQLINKLSDCSRGCGWFAIQKQERPEDFKG
eukprot:c20450_g1_i4 orf=183-731(+)